MNEVSASAFKMFAYFCSRKDNETNICFPSLRTTAKDCGLNYSYSSVMRQELVDKGWIDLYENRVVKVVIGFGYSKTTLDIPHEISKTSLENPHTPLDIPNSHIKELTNSINYPHLTRDNADSENPSSANKPVVKRKSSKPSDPRSEHPAIRMVHAITTRYPHKDLWDKIIREIGDNPDTEFFQTSFDVWRSVNGNPLNLAKWLFEPNKTKQLPVVYGSQGDYRNAPNGAGKPPAENLPTPQEVQKINEEFKKNQTYDTTQIRL